MLWAKVDDTIDSRAMSAGGAGTPRGRFKKIKHTSYIESDK